MGSAPLTDGHWVMSIAGHRLPDKELIGGKAWSIARMGTLGLPVPPAFVVTTRACIAYLETGAFPIGLVEEIAAGIAWLESETGRHFGSGPRPLLVSVRSGAPISMPGMMDTILNLGINDATEQLLAADCADERFARDTHRRFIELYASIVLKVESGALGNAEDLTSWREAIAAVAGAPLPVGVVEQLHGAVRAVFESWNSRRARRYREHHGIPHHFGTAVVVQAMVFGNLDEQSGTGVLFSRNPVTGERSVFGEFLPKAQGEDVVSGRHTPLPFAEMRNHTPDAFAELVRAAELLERVNGDVQDIEFTVERSRLFLLQTRAAKRSPLAAVRIAAEMVREGIAEPDSVFAKLTSEQVRHVLSPRLPGGIANSAVILARGEGASAGIGCGVVVTDPDEAETRAHNGEDVVLVRATTSPNDIHGMIAARAIVTEQGGATSHAAVVGRALGRPVIVGCGVGTVLPLAGRMVTVDGGSGVIYADCLQLLIPAEDDDAALADLLRWAELRSPVKVVAAPPPHAPVFDLDAVDGVVDPDNLRRSLSGVEPGTALHGHVLSSETAVAACVESGATLLIANPRLPVLLAAIRAAADRSADNPKDPQR
jgi:pyruvate,orthophosphate dikinase